MVNFILILLKKITKQKINSFYKSIYLIYNKNRLLISFNIPSEDNKGKFTIIDHMVIIYIMLMISGLFATFNGGQHISLFLSSFLSLSIFLYFSLEICNEIIKKCI